MAHEERVVRFVYDGKNGTTIERDFIAKDKGGGLVEGVEVGVFLNFKKVLLPIDLFNKDKYPCITLNRNCNGRITEILVYPHGPCLECYTPGQVLTSQDNELARLRTTVSQQKHALTAATYHLKSVNSEDQYHKKVLTDTAVWGKGDKNLRPVVVLDRHMKGAGVRSD